MIRKKRSIRKVLFLFVVVTFILVLASAYLTTRSVSRDDSRYLSASKLISKALIMRIFDQVERHFSSEVYAPTPFDSADFVYADLSHPYFEKIRNDDRIAHFYTNYEGSIDFADAIFMREFLRDLFPHGTSSKNYLNINVLEMIDAAEQGETFLCGSISKMLIQLVQAGGTQARAVALQSSHGGHVVVEIWSKRFNKWAIIDPDYNVHYEDAAGTPLSALEIYQMSQDDKKIEHIRRVAGVSPHTLHNSNTKLVELFYKNGFTIRFYNRWVDKNLPRRHPTRSPSIMGFYIGNSAVRKFYFKHNSDVITSEVRSKLYLNPAEYQAANNSAHTSTRMDP